MTILNKLKAIIYKRNTWINKQEGIRKPVSTDAVCEAQLVILEALVDLLERKPVKWSPTPEQAESLENAFGGDNPYVPPDHGPTTNVPEQQEQPKLSETDRELVKLLSEPVIVTSKVAKLLDEFFAFQQDKDHIPGPVETAFGDIKPRGHHVKH